MRVRVAGAWVLVVLWVLVIFAFSAETGELSQARSEEIVETVQKVAGNLGVAEKSSFRRPLNVMVRKSAHVLEYAVLAVLLVNALRFHLKSGNDIAAVAWVGAILLAIVDEVNQYYVMGRSGMFADVVVDSMGALLGLLALYVIKKLFEKNKEA